MTANRKRRAERSLLAPLVLALAVLAAGCGGGDDEGGATTSADGQALSGRIEADGSSTVAPFTTLAAERFQNQAPKVRVTVGVSGTGGGFERFCRGETDLSDASRPIKDEEAVICEQNGVAYVEFQVANDALTVVVNKANDWADCLTVDELKKIWEPGSKVSSWSDVRADFPDEPMKLFGAGTDSGTFDYFTDAIVRRGSSRGVSIGYFGILLVGFVLWVAYGVASDTVALVVPNTIAFLAALATVVVVVRYR